MAPQSFEHPNILIIVADALRADHLSCYGYSRETTPNLDRFAEANTMYSHAFTPATWTRSVAASILTGTYPSVHGVKTMNHTFSDKLPTIQKQLNEVGYFTNAVSAIGNFSSELGFGAGFDRFIDLYKDTGLPDERAKSSAEDEMLSHESGSVIFPRASDVFDRFIDIVADSDQDGPFFSLLWTIDPHDPYSPPKEHQPFVDSSYRGEMDGSRESLRRATNEEDFQRLIDLYDSELSYLDKQIKKLMDRLRQIDEYENTVIVFLGDHGEAFGDHDGNVGHSNLHYEELIRVPLLIRFPDGTEWDGGGRLASLIDIAPTVMRYIDEPYEHSLPESVSGQSLLDGGRNRVFGETHYSDAQNSYVSVRERRWKFIRVDSPNRSIQPYLELLSNTNFLRQFLRHPVYFLQRRFGTTSEHLYDLERDSNETTNRRDNEDVRTRLENELKQWELQIEKASLGRTAGSNNELDESTRKQLEEMGYID
jgi:arylsulfatase